MDNENVAFVPTNTDDMTVAEINEMVENAPIVDDAEVMPKVYSAASHRRHARSLLQGKKGLTDDEKIQRMVEARDSLDKAISMMQTGVVE